MSAVAHELDSYQSDCRDRFRVHFADLPTIASRAEQIRFTDAGCWEFPNNYVLGYARVKIDGRNVWVHRLSLERKIGEPLGNRVTRHQCDNPPCCNPDHLVPGSQADNARDMVERGRWGNKTFAGEDNWKSYPLSLVVAARSEYAKGMSQEAVAAKYGVSRGAVRDWVNGKRSDAGPSIARVHERPPCGTSSGYRSHENYGEEPCADCRTARNAYAREGYRRRKKQRT